MGLSNLPPGVTDAAIERFVADTSDDDDEFTPYPPVITDAPKDIWLVYGEIERDDTHEACAVHGDVGWCEDQQFESDVRYVRADLAEAPPIARSLGDWHEDIGPVLWWLFPVKEEPWCGTPLCQGWPGYHTHWTPIKVPANPEQSA